MPVSTDDRTKPASRQKRRLKEPEDVRVILLNDDYTTKEFVVAILMDVFHKNEDESYRIMQDVHQKGKGIVGVYSYDIALTKTEQVHTIARENEYPLRCVIEKA
ncbi:MAG: ATP-dependent Clp protease adaptor ClpS [Treponema sp.]|jgi:ATP-dependent Clp protease adaptor protein ClpS|nr:ATP-dependent Clp protease adaptor ClpS [Treponema sp.]